MSPFSWQRIRGPLFAVFGGPLDFYASHGYLIVPSLDLEPLEGTAGTPLPESRLVPRSWSVWVPSSMSDSLIYWDQADTLEKSKRVAREHRRGRQ